jgi:hypothetical protein
MTALNRLDAITEYLTRKTAGIVSRRSFVARLGAAITLSSGFPVLPVARAERAPQVQPQEKGDTQSCEYWRYCGVDGFLCSCCGVLPRRARPVQRPRRSPGWALPQPGGRAQLHHQLQRLLRQGGLRALFVHA